MIENQEKKWYGVKVHTGFENHVSDAIKQAVQSRKLTDQIFKVLVPVEKEVRIKNGKRVEKEVKVFPGHILVQMILSDQTLYAINNIDYVSGFLGSRSKPEPLADEEVEEIYNRIRSTDSVTPKLDIKVGSPVRITEGPFENLDGRVSEVDSERSEVTVLVPMFGRDTPVKLDVFQIKVL